MTGAIHGDGLTEREALDGESPFPTIAPGKSLG